MPRCLPRHSRRADFPDCATGPVVGARPWPERNRDFTCGGAARAVRFLMHGGDRRLPAGAAHRCRRHGHGLGGRRRRPPPRPCPCRRHRCAAPAGSRRSPPCIKNRTARAAPPQVKSRLRSGQGLAPTTGPVAQSGKSARRLCRGRHLGIFHNGASGTYLPVKGFNSMASVTFDKATRLYPGSERPAVDKLDLEIADGEFLVLVGPSGCGKSTSLRMLAGLEDVNGGRILIGDRDVTDVPPKDRDIAMVFQNYALYPHMSVADNMGFALKIAGIPKAEIRERVEKAAKILDLTQYLDRKPKALSGGQRQRVAMGRAIVRSPQVFLMDEPLSNLDAKLRVQTRTQIASLQRNLGVTTVYVTHDQVEAMTMGDRICVLKDGLLQQVGTPRELYDTPNNVFVAGFIGSPGMNIGRFHIQGDRAVLGEATIPLTRETIQSVSYTHLRAHETRHDLVCR